MPKFYLLDESLRSVAGHHFEFALNVLGAVQKRGYQPVLATHREFSCAGMISPEWQVHSLFPRALYDDPLLSPQPQGRLAGLTRWQPAANWAQWVRKLRTAARRRQMQQGYLEALRAIFRQTPLEDGDQVFLATASDLFLAALLDYFPEAPQTERADWHAQFHFNFLCGREPDYREQTVALRRWRELLMRAHQAARKHRLFTYATTDELARQLALAGGRKPVTLPYPTSPSFAAALSRPRAAGPLCVTYAGDARMEKGFQHLPKIVEQLWKPEVEAGRICFAIQANFNFRLPCRRRNRPLVQARTLLQQREGEGLKLYQQALSSREYHDLICSADIGLLPYDKQHYYPRCSGVVVEMLCAGVPIIVPAGCWMAEQLVEPIYQHLERLRERLAPTSTMQLSPFGRRSDARNNAGSEPPREPLLFAGKRRQARQQVPVPEGSTHALIRFDWQKPLDLGTFVRLRVQQFNRQSALIDDHSCVLGHRPEGLSPLALFPVFSQASRINLIWENAYHTGRIELSNVSLEFVAAPQGEDSLPSGAVGLIADGPQQFSRLLTEMIRHYDHYRRTAVEHARGWAGWHNSDRVAEELLARARASHRQDTAQSPAGPARRAAKKLERRA